MQSRNLTLILAVLGLTGYFVIARINLLWVAALVAAGIGFGFISPLVAVRRMGFLAAAAPHFALLAVAVSVIILSSIKIAAITSLIISIILIYGAGYLIHKGVDADLVTYLFVGFTAAASIIALYYALRSSAGYSLPALILGDPLLATRWEASYSLIAAGIVVLLSLTTYEAQVYSGVDKDDARLATSKLWLYDLAFFTALGIASTGLIRISGFILEHILILIPATIAAGLASSAREALALSAASALAASGVGGAVAIILNIAPAGAIGLTLIVIFAFLAILKR